MSRSLTGFLGFLLVLIIVGMVGTWFVGPNLVSLAFDEERRNAPYYLLNFAAGDPGVEYPSTYRAALAELVVADGGQLLWQAITVQVSEGRIEDEWQDVQLFEFALGRQLVEMLTSSSYRGIVDAHPEVARMILGTSTAPDALSAGQATVLSLLTVDQSARTSTDAAISRLLGDLPSYEGSLIWDAEVEDLNGEQPWNRALVLAFPTLERAESWLRDPQTVTERALAGTAAKQRVTLVLSSGTGSQAR